MIVFLRGSDFKSQVWSKHTERKEFTGTRDKSGPHGVMQIPGPEGLIRRAEAGAGAGGERLRALVHAPFSSTSGAGRDRQEEGNSIPGPVPPHSSSICTAELDGPARMWRAPLPRLLLVFFVCSVRWCLSEGKWCDFIIFIFFGGALFSHLFISSTLTDTLKIH